jgi:hypothetical protein
MDRKNKLLLSLVVFMGFVAMALLLVYVFVPAPERSARPALSEDWVTYTSDKYGFEIEHPADWIVAVGDEGFEPKINIYKKEETAKPPFIHHNNVTQVSLFPKGIGTEGVDGETATSTVKFGEQTSQAIDFILEGGQRWATYATFTSPNRPGSWNDFGFVWASVEVKDPSSECVLDGTVLSMEKCGLGDRPDGARIILRGSMDVKERETEERILETLRFFQSRDAQE